MSVPPESRQLSYKLARQGTARSYVIITHACTHARIERVELQKQEREAQIDLWMPWSDIADEHVSNS